MNSIKYPFPDYYKIWENDSYQEDNRNTDVIRILRFKDTDEEVNENDKGLTIEKLKTYKGLENLSDEEAEKIIKSIKQFVRILLKVKKFIKLMTTPIKPYCASHISKLFAIIHNLYQIRDRNFFEPSQLSF